MTAFGNSAFLQALGWATLNSFWQMAALWTLFLLAKHFFRLSSEKPVSTSIARNISIELTSAPAAKY
jgi:hypothetical protein